MTPEYTSMVNSPLMWFACTPSVLIILEGGLVVF